MADDTAAPTPSPSGAPPGLIGERTLRSKMAPVYAHLFPDLFDRNEVVESRATCDTCAMCDHGQTAPVAMDYFNPTTKCCTFFPGLPNYLVGAILADETEDLAEGRRRLRERIASHVGVTPQFIMPPRKYTVMYSAARGSTFFGRTESMLCPYYDGAGGGRCTVWRYREGVCSTYFCKYTAGKPGWQFWDAMRLYLGHVERSLAHYAAAMVDKACGQPIVTPLQLTAQDIDDLPPTDSDYAVYWNQGAWVGREEEFYIACYRHVMALQKEEFAKHVDDAPDGRGYLAKLEAKYEEISRPDLPPTLILASQLKKRDAGANVVVSTYNAFDTFSMEEELFEVLKLLREEETLEQNLARLDKEHDIQLAPELIRYLFTHGVLAPPDPEEKKKRDEAAKTAKAATASTSAGASMAAAHAKK